VTDTTPELEAWMTAKSRRTLLARIAKQLHTARRRGFKKTMIPLADLERLISE
jgi:hypothetical protein